MLKMFKKILLGIDKSENAMKAVDKVIEIQKETNAEVVVFHSFLHHITELTPTFVGKIDANLSYEIHNDIVKEGTKQLEDVQAKFEDKGLKVEIRRIFDFGPEYYIEEKVKEENFDLVVLGCGGKHSKLRRTIVGTVPEYVMNHVDVDVLIVK
ncbi:MAG: universal stress protein [Candidatus Lokiarchaeota archaeon]|nr:universal stress protein [Candidatus Lokiarchaeota archaeon]